MASFIYAPSHSFQITQFYLFWIVAYVVAHVVIDARSPHTKQFELHDLKSKVHVPFAGTTFATSLLLLIAAAVPSVFDALSQFKLSLIIAGVAGLLISLGELGPKAANGHD